MLSEKTKKQRLSYRLLLMFHVLLNILPLTYFTIKAYLNSNVITERITLSLVLAVVVILTAVTFINKTVLRSRLWIMLIGLWVCLDSIVSIIVIIAICQVVDELIAEPMCKKSKALYHINREIDKRS